MKIALIQMPVNENIQVNIRYITEKIHGLKKDKTDLVMLPEMFSCPYETKKFPLYAEAEGGELYNKLSYIAKENKIYLIAGSVPESDNGKIYNTSYVFNRNGEKIAKHRKIHLFDIDIKGGQYFRESDILSHGDKVTVFDTEFGRFGLAICFDIRFPELSRKMVELGASAIFIPAAFNMTTGPAHWDILFKARAIDNQVFMIGAAPSRDMNASYHSYGHSLIVNPWGDVINELLFDEGILTADIELKRVEEIRKQLPVLSAMKKEIYY